jgi:hypothetical protein
VFVGSGTFSLAVPLAVERGAIRRVLKDSLMGTPITGLVLFFADSTLAELERRLSFGSGTPGGPAAGAIGDALGYLIDGDERSADATLMSALLNGDANGLFYAFVKRQRGEHLMSRWIRGSWRRSCCSAEAASSASGFRPWRSFTRPRTCATACPPRRSTPARFSSTGIVSRRRWTATSISPPRPRSA